MGARIGEQNRSSLSDDNKDRWAVIGGVWLVTVAVCRVVGCMYICEV